MDPDPGVLMDLDPDVLVGSGCFGWIGVVVFRLDPDPGVLAGSGYGCFGWIRILVFWSDPDLGVLV